MKLRLTKCEYKNNRLELLIRQFYDFEKLKVNTNKLYEIVIVLS